MTQGLDAEVALRALAHPGRRQMLQLVWDGERSSTDLADRCGLSKPAASQHLKVLREAELVTVRVDGTRRLYRARAERLAELQAFLDDFWGTRLEALRAAVESTGPSTRTPR
ncbi:MAG: metalloregulator ArsR/SmtB family transcription factor [Actinomycetota bacterium]|nr:metalloregulator ArsR/SmtB family transcription factor [Actinomycetota bacterium]